MRGIREFLGAEVEKPEPLTGEDVFSVQYGGDSLEFQSYDPPLFQKVADLMHLEPTPEYVVRMDAERTRYFELTHSGAKNILQNSETEF